MCMEVLCCSMVVSGAACTPPPPVQDWSAELCRCAGSPHLLRTPDSHSPHDRWMTSSTALLDSSASWMM